MSAQRFSLTAAAVLLLTAGLCAQLPSSSFHVVNIPNFSAGGDPGLSAGGYPKVDGYDVVWTGWVGPPPGTPGGNAEIFRFDGAQTHQVTSNPAAAYSYTPFISNYKRIAYVEDDGATKWLKIYDIPTAATTTLQNLGAWKSKLVSFHDHFLVPQLAVEVMDFWLGGPWVPNWISIDLWDGSGIVTLSERFYDYGAQAAQYYTAWHSGWSVGGPFDIYLYNAGTVSQMTFASGNWSYRDPQLSAPYLVWWGSDGSSTVIKLCNLNQGINYRHTIDSTPSYKSTLIRNAYNYCLYVWEDDIIPTQHNIYVHKHNPPFHSNYQIYPTQPHHLPCQVTSLDVAYFSSTAVFAAWAVWDGLGHYEIYFRNLGVGGSPQMIFAGPTSTPVYVRISGRNAAPYGFMPVIIWEQDFGGAANQAFMATRPVCSAWPTGDLDQNCAVDNADLAIMQSQWNQTGFGLSADLNSDGAVNTLDLMILLTVWMNHNIQPAIYWGKGVTFP